jgi:hypothetical protein
MTKIYLKDLEVKEKERDKTEKEPPNYHMWARLGAVDGLRYLSKHF